MKDLYIKMKKSLTVKNITWVTTVLFILMILPILYCSFFNRASGDDLGYSIFTKAAWSASHSFIELLKAAWLTIKKFYVGWQGTWFSIFLFTLQPEIFHEKAYVIVVFMILFLWIFSTSLMLRKILKDVLELDNWCVRLIILSFLIICISFVPKKKSAIFWYNGCAHYMIPLVMCQIVVYWLLKYCEKYKLSYLIYISVFMTLLGGTNYQAALFVLIVAVYVGVADYCIKKEKRTLYLLMPILLEMVGLIISMKAPGNMVRGGENFGFSLELVVSTVLKSFILGIQDIIFYLRTIPMILVGIIVLFLVLLKSVIDRDRNVVLQHPILMSLSVFCLYSAMQAPAIYAGVEVSGGVYNMNFLTFMLMVLIFMIVIAEKVGHTIKQNDDVKKNKIQRILLGSGMVLCTMMVVLFRSNIKESTTWMCIEYVATGQAADYKMQMEQFTELMKDDSVEDVVVPFINDVQGPLMHMPVTENPEAWTNTVVADYYNKNSVIAMPRPEWEEKYGKE